MAAGPYDDVNIDKVGVRLPADVQSQYRPLLDQTSTVLGAGATYTSAAYDVSDLAFITVVVFADQASATDGLVVEQSGNGGTNYDSETKQSYTANAKPAIAPIAVVGDRARTKYVNGATLQGAFRLSTFGRTI